jgi:ABC-type transport system substrate-binding protein
MYLNVGSDWADTAEFLEQDLAKIGITINPVGVSLDELYEEQGLDPDGQCVSATSANGGPFYMGQEFYTSDYISPDDWTQNDFVSTGSANECMAGFNSGASSGYNATYDAWVYDAASDSNSADLTSYYTNMTQVMYENYSEIWLVVPTSFAVYTTNLHGYIFNPMASAEPFAIGFNTQWLS